MKARFLALAALVLGMASCQQNVEIDNHVVGGEVDFQLSVVAPELGATRAADNDNNYGYDSAYGAIDYLYDEQDDYRTDWTDVDLRYQLEVYDVDVDYTSKEVNPVKDRQVVIVDKYEPVKFNLRLVPNREYRFVVFADFVPQGADDTASIELQKDLGLHHTIEGDLRNITIKDDAINDECTDAYFAIKDIEIKNSAAQDILLKRPYGKLRVIATDLAELNFNINATKVEVSYYAKHPQTFNAVTGVIGAVVEEERYEFESLYNEEVGQNSLANHFYTEDYDAKTVTNDNGDTRHSHITLFTDYILAMEDEQSPVSFDMTVYDGNEIIKHTEFSTNIPIERNHLTTVIGNVLTTATEINVTIDDNFEGNHEYQLWDGKSVSKPKQDDQFNYLISNAAELAWLAQEVNKGETFLGATFLVVNNIHLNGERWTPIGNSSKHNATFRGTLDGQGHAIEDLFVDNEQGAGLFGMVSPKAIRNLTIINADVNSNHYAGALAGWIQSVDSQEHNRGVIENCHVKDATVTLSVVDGDNGDKAGALVGYAVRLDITDCSVDNAVVKAYRDVGGLVGHANSTTVVSNNTITNSKVIADQEEDYIEAKEPNAGKVVGRVSTEARIEDNTAGSDVKVIYRVNTADELNAAAKANNGYIFLCTGSYALDNNINAYTVHVEGDNAVLDGQGYNATLGTSNDYAFITRGSGSSFVIDNVNLTSGGGAFGVDDGAQLTINGGSYTIKSSQTSGRHCVYAVGAGTKVTINGGTFAFETGKVRRSYVYAGAGATVYINGGTFGKASTRDGYTAGILGDGKVIINAGTFGFDPTNWVADDSLVTKIGNQWIVTGARVIYSTEQLKAAMTTEYVEGQTLYLVNGYYEGLFDFTGKTLTLKGTNGADYIKGLVWADNCNVTFQDVHFLNPEGVQHPNTTNSQYFATINNQYPLVGAYLNSNLKFVNCTFHISNPTIYGFYGYANNNATFEDCRFECNGIRPIANNGDELTITGCTFDNAYHYAARIFENSGERQTVIFKNNTMTGSNAKGEFEGINISKKGTTATVFADFEISNNTASLKYRYHKDVTLDASCTGADLFEREQ